MTATVADFPIWAIFLVIFGVIVGGGLVLYCLQKNKSEDTSCCFRKYVEITQRKFSTTPRPDQNIDTVKL